MTNYLPKKLCFALTVHIYTNTSVLFKHWNVKDKQRKHMFFNTITRFSIALCWPYMHLMHLFASLIKCTWNDIPLLNFKLLCLTKPAHDFTCKTLNKSSNYMRSQIVCFDQSLPFVLYCSGGKLCILVPLIHSSGFIGILFTQKSWELWMWCGLFPTIGVSSCR